MLRPLDPLGTHGAPRPPAVNFTPNHSFVQQSHYWAGSAPEISADIFAIKAHDIAFQKIGPRIEVPPNAVDKGAKVMQIF